METAKSSNLSKAGTDSIFKASESERGLEHLAE